MAYQAQSLIVLIRVTQETNSLVNFDFENRYIKPKSWGFGYQKIKSMASKQTIVFSNPQKNFKYGMFWIIPRLRTTDKMLFGSCGKKI